VPSLAADRALQDVVAGEISGTVADTIVGAAVGVVAGAVAAIEAEGGGPHDLVT
jgi:hypothetical protein